MELHVKSMRTSKSCVKAQAFLALLVHWHPAKRAIILFISAAGSRSSTSQHVSINWDRRWSGENKKCPQKVFVQVAVNVIQWTPIKIKYISSVIRTHSERKTMERSDKT